MKWFRMYADMANDPKIGTLSDGAFRTWVELLCIACHADNNGLTDLTENTLEWALRRNVTETFQELLQKHLVIINKSRFIQISAWEKRQYLSDSSTDRVRKCRENKKKLHTIRSETLQEQKCNALDTDTDTERKEKILKRKNPDCPYSRIVTLYHETLPDLPRVEKLTVTRKGFIRQRWLEDLRQMEHWENYFNYVASSDFLMGRTTPRNGSAPFIADLEWLTRPGNYAKVAEEKYHRV